MKNNITTIVLLILLPLAVAAGKKPTQGAVIQFQCETYDYHNITQGSSGICYFVYANKAQSRLCSARYRQAAGVPFPIGPKNRSFPVNRQR